VSELIAGLQAPLVHINGTSRAELLKQLSDCFNKCMELEDTMRAARPHARDYYPLEPHCYEGARDEHRRRELFIVQVRHEYAALLLAVHNRETVTK
jgi:folate-dependent tRNA-U54 methylase TrmFO/GidA